MSSRFSWWAMCLILLLGLTGCQQADQDPSVKQVGILQFSENPTMDQVVAGFKKGLADHGFREDDNLVIDLENAAQDHSNLYGIAGKMTRVYDLSLGLGTPPTQALANAGNDNPIVFAAVSDPKGANLVASYDRPGGNVTGASDMVLPNQGIDFLRQHVPELKTIGVLYNAGEVNSQIQFENVKAYGESVGLKVEGMTITNTNDVQHAITALAGKVDAVYLPTDHSIVQTIATIANTLHAMKVPAVGADVAQLEACIATFGVNYEERGYRAGEMAAEILQGQASPAELAVDLPDKLDKTINDDMAHHLGFDPKTLKEEN
ncbi:hypothetical protein AWM75_05540 [Aerococcus urinaehominis]|uniref:Uncharacterized protein n=1 Tax=Aerococcus urinaehominis TaxID=128944 RepID=A0A109RGX0_9LACT|nr:ABC transporter substrate-binding protein [Aerococcus urinaehominis]AMB99489.1 hypothetical protein AWM75_05540 [Aerococcus urinaehominis]SDM26646.1 putative ABC transport system substrate-binding protein [Aerococcus urinaehominis]